ncbi:amidohydrolase family protein [uncultured Microbulbifer sp.]|uniref:amidohydrolase n=1 Tax=uncultured Microbulbifer sp. TaxID=348147 RepID=UPI00261404D7|nr:amidohydrolase family protein [uncultured Microbulbifer sp.]
MRLLCFLSIFLLLSCDPREKRAALDSTLTQPAQLILRNATIYTVDRARSLASAIAIRDGRIAFVGSEKGVEAYIGPKTNIKDLDGKLVLPGFFQRVKVRGSAGKINLFSGKSIEDYCLSVSRYIRENPQQQVIVGEGWNMQAFSGEPPHKGILDQINDLIPIILFSSDGNNIWTNSEGLAAAGIDSDTENPRGGVIEKNEHGLATGWLHGRGAKDLLQRLIPENSSSNYRDDLLRIQRLATRNGITTLYEAALHSVDEISWKNYKDQLSTIGAMDIRLRTSWPVSADFTDKEFLLLQQRIGQIRSDDFSVDSVSFIGWAAEIAETQNVKDRAASQDYSQGVVADLARRANHFNLPLQIVVSGKEFTASALEALESLKPLGSDSILRNVIINASFDRVDLQRLAQANTVLFIQPETMFAHNMALFRVSQEDELKVQKKYFPLGFSLLSADLSANHAMVNPLEVIKQGLVYKIPVSEMIAAFTINAAYAGGLEKETGSLEAGKWADFIVLDRNMFGLEESEQRGLKVLETFYKGQLVFDINNEYEN